MTSSAPPTRAIPNWFDAAIIAAVGIALLAWTWDRGPDPVVDFGRECYVPWRIAAGEVLYRDIHYFNGPLSPHVNALVFKLLGVSLRSLKIANALVIACCAALIYHLARRASDRLAATSAAIIFLTLFAFAHLLGVGNYNFLTPYSHDLTHGMALSLAAIASLDRFTRSKRIIWAGVGGFALGLTFLTKAEIFLAALLAVGCGLALLLLARRENRMRCAVVFTVSVLAPIVLAFVLLLRNLSAAESIQALEGSWIFLGNRQLTGLPYFRSLSGTADVGASLRTIAIVSMIWIIALASTAGIGWLLRFVRERKITYAIAIAWAILIGSTLWLMRMELNWDLAARPLPAFALVIVIGLLAKFVRARGGEQPILPLMLSIFAAACMLKILLNVKLSHYGFALAMPGTVLAVVAAVGWLPRLIERRGGAGIVPRLAALSVLLVVTLVHLWITSYWIDFQTTTIAPGTPDEFHADFRGGPMGALVADLDQFTRPDETLVMMPEGLIANFLARRVNPTTHLNFTPPALIMYGQQQMLADFERHPPDYIAIFNHDSAEYGARFFGIDYGQELVRWIGQHYARVKSYGAPIEQRDKIGGITLFKRK
jgi:4-amino-4-deoxy-L-arabinose transferase-like glycosyltransferase